MKHFILYLFGDVMNRKRNAKMNVLEFRKIAENLANLQRHKDTPMK
jgi:hypothetical protein